MTTAVASALNPLRRKQEDFDITGDLRGSGCVPKSPVQQFRLHRDHMNSLSRRSHSTPPAECKLANRNETNEMPTVHAQATTSQGCDPLHTTIEEGQSDESARARSNCVDTNSAEDFAGDANLILFGLLVGAYSFL